MIKLYSAAVTAFALMASQTHGTPKPIANVSVNDAQFNVLGNYLSGQLTFTISPDSANIMVTNGKMTMPLIVRNPLDPVYQPGPEDAFYQWRNSLHDRLLADPARTEVSVAIELADSLQNSGCTNIRRTGSTIIYDRVGSFPVTTRWTVTHPPARLPAAECLRLYLEPLLKELEGGRAVFVVWSGAAINLRPDLAARLQHSQSDLRRGLRFRSQSEWTHPDVNELLQHPVNPTSLKQEE